VTARETRATGHAGPGGAASTAEVMAVAIARMLRDGETIAVGSVSPIPASACLLAKATHAPRARLILLGSAEHFPFTAGMQEFYNFALRGRLDVFFASGAQIDQHGNFNLSVIGEHARPTVRLPGGRANGILSFVARRVILFRTEHGPRVFVPKVDFVTSPGSTPENVYRLGGLHAVVSDLGVLAFHPERRRLELASVHPGVTPAEIQARTGFPLHPSDPVPTTPAPTPAELALLRTTVRERLATFYPQFVQQQA
jgi:glutaconate CoA-transferase subunit B